MAGHKVATPWGQGVVVEEAKVQQRVAGRSFATVVQLIETEVGDALVRIAYTTDGVVRRGPATLRPRDIVQLREKLGKESALAHALGWTS